jgi:hypothetical protein
MGNDNKLASRFIGGIEFSEIEIQILELDKLGLSPIEIAARVGLKPSTIAHKLTLGKSPQKSLPNRVGVPGHNELKHWYASHRQAERTLHRLYSLYPHLVNTLIAGRASLALDLNKQLLNQVNDNLAQDLSSGLHHEYLKLKILLLNEKIRAFQDRSLPGNALTSTATLLNQAFKIAATIREKELSGLVHLLKAVSLYIDTNYLQALQELKDGWLECSQVENQLWLGRFELLCLANLEKHSQFVAALPKVLDLLEAGRAQKLQMICDVREGLARGQAKLKLEGWEENLGENWDQDAQLVGLLPYATLPRIHRARTHLEIAKLLKLKWDRELAVVHQAGLQSAQEGEIARYIYYFNTFTAN